MEKLTVVMKESHEEAINHFYAKVYDTQEFFDSYDSVTYTRKIKDYQTNYYGIKLINESD